MTPPDTNPTPLETGQLDLYDPPPPLHSETIQARFDQFHTDHPNVYQALVDMARGLKHRGHNRLAIGMLWETLRYQTMLGNRPGHPNDDPYRLNDHYRSRYARLIMDTETDLNDIFHTRQLTTT